MASAWAVPAAILGAGGLIGLGLYFGLRASEPVPSEPAAPHPQPEPATAPAALAPRAPAEARRQTAEARAKAAVEQIRGALVETCWDPSAAENPEPAAISVGLSMSFDARGKVRGIGVIERREASRPDISQCLTDAVYAVSIEGVGQPVSVEVELELP